MSQRNLFTEHPASVGESYGEHFVAAMGFAFGLLKAAFCCTVHAFLPFLFERTGSRCIEELHDRMVVHRARAARRPVPAHEARVQSAPDTARLAASESPVR